MHSAMGWPEEGKALKPMIFHGGYGSGAWTGDFHGSDHPTGLGMMERG